MGPRTPNQIMGRLLSRRALGAVLAVAWALLNEVGALRVLHAANATEKTTKALPPPFSGAHLRSVLEGHQTPAPTPSGLEEDHDFHKQSAAAVDPTAGDRRAIASSSGVAEEHAPSSRTRRGLRRRGRASRGAQQWPPFPNAEQLWTTATQKPVQVQAQTSSNASKSGVASRVGGAVAEDLEQSTARPSASSFEFRNIEHWRQVLFAVAEGTGVVPGTERNSTGILRQTLDFRARCQTEAVLVMLALTYMAVIVFALHSLYLQLQNDSPVTYYADPRYHSAAMDGDDLDDFLSTFNLLPQAAYLHVTGLEPIDGLGTVHDAQLQQTAFDFSLDVSSWIVRVSQLEALGSACAFRTGRIQRPYEGGISPMDLQVIAEFLSRNDNDLASLEIHLNVAWAGWEEIATNIRQRIRQCGFDGTVEIAFCEEKEVIIVHKNKLWANFMHSHNTKALAVMSIIGFIPYWIYMWMRCRSSAVTANLRVNIQPEEYWRLIGNKLGAAGFYVSSYGAGSDMIGTARWQSPGIGDARRL